MKKVIQKIFDLTATLLRKSAKKLHLTYNEINILVYYLIIPFTWCVMLDIALHTYITSLIFAVLWAGIFIATYGIFSEWCDWRFRDSVQFLNRFKKIGWDYEKSSVIICVIVPIIIYGILLLFQFLNN